MVETEVGGIRCASFYFSALSLPIQLHVFHGSRDMALLGLGHLVYLFLYLRLRASAGPRGFSFVFFERYPPLYDMGQWESESEWALVGLMGLSGYASMKTYILTHWT
jgi:hypothetical protein